MKKTIIIDGNNFSSVDSFYDEVENKFTKNLDWKIGRNMNAFNDVLNGGFGMHEYEEPIIVKWINSNKSETDLGWNETIKFVENTLRTCHPNNIEDVKKDLELCRQYIGETLFQLIIKTLKNLNHIELIML